MNDESFARMLFEMAKFGGCLGAAMALGLVCFTGVLAAAIALIVWIFG